jgi:hypothetical protein
MSLIDGTNQDENWYEVLAKWNRIANWQHYNTSDLNLRREMKEFLIALWNEKDWLKHQYPEKSKDIESFIDKSEYMCIVGDLANTAKHRKLTKKSRSTASQTEFFGRVTVNNSSSRQLHFISLENGNCLEIMSVLRGALDELTKFRRDLRSGTV